MTIHSKPLTALLTDPLGRALGLGLPPGSLVTETNDGPWSEPLLWVADEVAAPGTWAEYLPARDVGLQPVLLQNQSGIEEWWDGELDPGMMSDPSDHPAEEVLKDFWESAASETEENEDEEDAGQTMDPFTGSWPGLASPGRLAADPTTTAADVAKGLVGHSLKSPRLALVPVGRAADIPAAIGWSGPVNYENDVARLCAVLRSWEDRFGVRVVALSYARLDLSVAAPPQTMDEALAIAAEHFAFCPDNIWQGYESIRLYAEEALVGNAHWTFWWD
ncbi:DUF4253 domain-containing protein [Streptomyces sp. NBC_00335]|uniref:DUF4253 domain-containing protein n=1 Tax=unclassified Streptomyces TaxID=2593676 RepID=UPI00224D9640|nr:MULTISPECIES: DUF4253 domain-containing protein [unclassified Streptomyces]MCX5409730.1 DUF4253 domain-containing protein [Streptomyces sp. NBC_00086]